MSGWQVTALVCLLIGLVVCVEGRGDASTGLLFGLAGVTFAVFSLEEAVRGPGADDDAAEE